ncbi:MAG: hypothetical protein HC765_13455 [Brachymonas sp.]|nr:hypothetical protein [Brachymonas sp.]
MPRKDIYWQFAELSQYRYWNLPNPHVNWYLQTLIELQPKATAEELHQWFKSQGQTHLGFVSRHYRSLPNRFCTAWVSRGALSRLPTHLVVRFKMGLPTNPNAFYPLEAFRAVQRTNSIGRFFRNMQNVPMATSVVTGIIDDQIDTAGCLGVGSSRLIASWDQNTNESSGTVPPRFGYRLLPTVDKPKQAAVSHGTLVASIAAGGFTPQYRSRQTLLPMASKSDAASTLPVMTVQLRQDTVVDTSGRRVICKRT